MNTVITAWLLIFNASMDAQPVSVQAIANYEACIQLGKDMKGSRKLPYYACYDYPIVDVQQAARAK